jgi:hypothetical protein
MNRRCVRQIAADHPPAMPVPAGLAGPAAPHARIGSMRVSGSRVTTSVMPELSVRRGRDAIHFYKRAFGATEQYRVGGTHEHPDVVAQLAIDDAAFWVSDESPEHENFSPESVGGSAGSGDGSTLKGISAVASSTTQ